MNRSALAATRRIAPPFAISLAVSLVAAFAAGAAIAAQDGQGQQEGKKSASFSARLTLAEVIVPAGGGACFLAGIVTGSGTASQLGRVTAASQDCVNFRGDPSANSFSFHNNTAPAGLVFVGESGEQLFARYSGTLTARPKSPHRVSGLFVITGGTGRYTGATGGGEIEGHEDISQPGSGQGEVRLDGVLSY